MNYRKLPDRLKYSDDEIHQHIDHVVKLVSDFADEVLSDVHLIELTPDNVKQYIRYVADDLFNRLNHSKYYNVNNPFVWMNFTDLVPKTNFYEGTVGEYSRFNVDNVIDEAYRLCNGVDDKKVPEINSYKIRRF